MGEPSTEYVPQADLSGLKMPLSNEELVCALPIIVRKRVAFGECDPAGIVYTPRFADYLVAAHWWLREIVLPQPSIDLPMRGLTLDFQEMMRAGDRFDMRVEVGEIRSRTFDIVIKATAVDGRPTFAGTLTPIAFDPVTRRSVSLPDDVRLRLTAYGDACRAVG